MVINEKKGFTLVELLVTLIIITIAASVMFPVSRINYVRDKEDDLRYYLRRMREGIDDFYERNPAGAPTGEVVLDDGVDNDGDGVIDEEIDDNLDNDGDGLIDEDLLPHGYPISLADMVNNQCIRRIPDEPFGAKWQYRNSSGGEWTDFLDYGVDYRAQPGDDIYDIRTDNSELSIKGEPYTSW
ncbi:MAG: type II secretion system protein [Candidatus Muiribacteriaceae bacterium]